MPKESSPDINIPFFSITTIYPWADAKTVKEQITSKIENAINWIENISSYKSISSANVSALTVQFKRWTNKNTAYNDLKAKLDEIKTQLPENIKSIKLKKMI